MPKNKKTNNLIKLIILLLLIIGSFVFYYFYPQADIVYKGEPATVRLALAKIEATAMVRIAQHKKFFEKYGINLIVIEKDLGKDCLDEVFNGNADLATVAESPIAKEAFERDDFLILATIHSATRNVKVIAHRDSGINKVSDLEGKKIGTSINTVGEFFLYDLLRHVSLSFADITLVDASAEELKEKFLNKEIDALSLREPHIYQLGKKLDQKKLFITYGKDNFLSTFNIVGDKDYVDNNRDVLKRFLQALYESEQYMNKNKEKVMKIISEDLNLDTDYLYESCAGSECVLQLNQRLILELEAEARWLIDRGVFKQQEVPNYLDYFELDLLEEVKPESTKTLR